METAFMDQKFLRWMHQVTRLGYDIGLTIPASFEEEVKKLYEKKLTPEQAIDELKPLLKKQGGKIDFDDFVGIDHGDNPINLLEISQGKMPIEMRPVQLHHKNNGAKGEDGDKPSFAIVMAPAGGTLVYGQLSFEMWRKAFDQVGYTLVKKEKT